MARTAVTSYNWRNAQTYRAKTSLWQLNNCWLCWRAWSLCVTSQSCASSSAPDYRLDFLWSSVCTIASAPCLSRHVITVSVSTHHTIAVSFSTDHTITVSLSTSHIITVSLSTHHTITVSLSTRHTITVSLSTCQTIAMSPSWSFPGLFLLHSMLQRFLCSLLCQPKCRLNISSGRTTLTIICLKYPLTMSKIPAGSSVLMHHIILTPICTLTRTRLYVLAPVLFATSVALSFWSWFLISWWQIRERSRFQILHACVYDTGKVTSCVSRN